MKKFFVLAMMFAALSGNAFAADDLKFSGTVKSINAAQQTVTLADINKNEQVFAVVPSTEIEIERKKGRDKKGAFADLKEGDWITVEYPFNSQGAIFVGEEIKIYR